MEKEFLYVGYYEDKEGRYILKVGTTNNLERRRKEHNTKYHNASYCRMPIDKEFTYLWSLPLSKYNTLRYEDKAKELWKEQEIGMYLANDRFILFDKPEFVEVKIRKTYKIFL